LAMKGAQARVEDLLVPAQKAAVSSLKSQAAVSSAIRGTLDF
jgi:hypothetical protein